MATYTDGEHRTSFVHAVSVCPSTDVFHVFSIVLQPKLLVHEQCKCLHSVGASTDTDKLLIKMNTCRQSSWDKNQGLALNSDVFIAFLVKLLKLCVDVMCYVNELANLHH